MVLPKVGFMKLVKLTVRNILASYVIWRQLMVVGRSCKVKKVLFLVSFERKWDEYKRGFGNIF